MSRPSPAQGQTDSIVWVAMELGRSCSPFSCPSSWRCCRWRRDGGHGGRRDFTGPTSTAAAPRGASPASRMLTSSSTRICLSAGRVFPDHGQELPERRYDIAPTVRRAARC